MLGRALCRLIEPLGYTIIKIPPQAGAETGHIVESPPPPIGESGESSTELQDATELQDPTELQAAYLRLQRELENSRLSLTAVTAESTARYELLTKLMEWEREFREVAKLHQVNVKLPISLSEKIVNGPNIFLHLGKTGGGTLTETVRHSPNSAEVATKLKLFDKLKKQLRSGRKVVIGSHTGYGWHRVLDIPPHYFTLLRDPVERLVSEYFYGAAHPGRRFVAPEQQVDGFVRYVDSLTNANFYCATFARHSFHQNTSFENADRDSPEGLRRTLIYAGDNEEFLAEPKFFEGRSAEEDFEKSMANLEEDFFFVGMFERLEESMFILFGLLGWKSILVDVPNNVTHNRPALSEIPRATLDRLERLTEWDRKLYRTYRKRFDDLCNKCEFGPEFERYRKHNQLLRTWNKLTASL